MPESRWTRKNQSHYFGRCRWLIVDDKANRDLCQRESVSTRWNQRRKTFGLHVGPSADHLNAARNYSRQRHHM